MSTRTRTLIALLAVFALANAPLAAGEFGGNAGAAGESDGPVVVEANEAGVAAVYQAQAARPVVLHAPDKTAIELLESFAMAQGYNPGWDSDKKRFFALQYSAFNTNDPAGDRDFLVKREIAAKNAILSGKVDVIRFVATEMSAADQFETPGTDVYAELNEEFLAVRHRLEVQRQEVAKLLELADRTEAEALAGATLLDRIVALLDAAIKRLGADFDAGRIAGDKRDVYDRQKVAYLEAKAQYDVLLKQAETIRGNVLARSSSVVSLMSAMPIAGATVIQQAESWNPASKQYEVAVLLCWSAQLELAARATLTDMPSALNGAAGSRSVNDWLEAQDLGAMIGPRQFLDDKGRRYFIGITARPVRADANIDRQNRSLADVFAAQMAVFSLFADVRAATEATQATLTTVAGDFDRGTVTKVVESLQESMTQSFQDMQIHGLQPLKRARVKHALTGIDMHVSVYGVSAQDAAAAMKMQEDAARAAIAIHRNQAFKRARTDEINRQVEGAINDRASREAGTAAGKSAVDEPRPAQQSGTTAPAATPAVRPDPSNPESVPGAVLPGGKVDDDF